MLFMRRIPTSRLLCLGGIEYYVFYHKPQTILPSECVYEVVDFGAFGGFGL